MSEFQRKIVMIVCFACSGLSFPVIRLEIAVLYATIFFLLGAMEFVVLITPALQSLLRMIAETGDSLSQPTHQSDA